MPMREQFVIVGGGLAGAKAAETLRAEGFTGGVVLIGAESERPYERPPLSKGLLLGKSEPEAAYVHPADWYGANDVELRTGESVIAIDRDHRGVELASGTIIGYDRLLLTTGSAVRRLALHGTDLDGVLYLRTMQESRLLQQRLAGAANVVVIGAGWIGLEVAAAARAGGANVTVVESLPIPMQRTLGDEIGRLFQAVHEAKGVTFRLNAGVTGFRGGTAVGAVELADGTTLPADVVVVGVGIQPNIQLAREAGLAVANGITVDASLRTSDPLIFAAGDVADAYHPLLGRPIRVEHWANALNGGPAAARSMLGKPVTYDRLPYFYTDQYDLGMEYAGFVEPGGYDRVVFRGDPAVKDGATPAFLAFWVRDDRVLAGMNVNVWDVQDDIQRLVRAGFRGGAVDLDKLTDENVALQSIEA